MIVTQFIALPVLLQMVLYTLPIIYIGSHLSLLQKEINPETGEKQIKTEALTHHDAMLFPFIGSAALLSLYVAYRFLPAYWVNLLLTLYLSLFGCVATGETLMSIVEKITPASWDINVIALKYSPPSIIKKWTDVIEIQACRRRIISYIGGISVGLIWLITKHWTFHNLFAISFCLQGIRMVSVGSFKISIILLCGLFVYDIFWVFGTDVMVTVAKSFEAPAKIIFPVSYNPWKQSILGLGDVVLPGIFIAMILRFDHHLHELYSENQSSDGDKRFDIHQKFPKFYFWFNLVAYETGLITTGLVMLFSRHAQPALLYLVPFCLVGLFGPAWFQGQLIEVLKYSEESPEESKQEQTDESKALNEKDKKDQ